MVKDRDIKSVIVKIIEKIFTDKMFDFFWSKYYIWSVKQKGAKISERAYYVRNKDGLKKPNYCIFRFQYEVGLFAMANRMLFCYQWAMDNKYIPLVDHEFYEDFLGGSFGLRNLWEACFKQSVSLGEVFNKGNVLVSEMNAADIISGAVHSVCKAVNGDSHDRNVHAQSQDYKAYYARLNQLSKKVWIFQPEVEAEIKKVQEKLFHPGMRVMAVVLREAFGMDENEMTEEQKKVYKIHPKAITLEETYKLIVEYMAKWNCTHVLITTMFQDSLEYFQEKLGENKVISIERKRGDFNKWIREDAKSIEEGVTREICERNGESKQEAEQTAISYLIEMAAVANCDYCMGVKSSGLIAACIMNGGKFKDLYIFEDYNNIQNY